MEIWASGVVPAIKSGLNASLNPYEHHWTDNKVIFSLTFITDTSRWMRKNEENSDSLKGFSSLTDSERAEFDELLLLLGDRFFLFRKARKHLLNFSSHLLGEHLVMRFVRCKWYLIWCSAALSSAGAAWPLAFFKTRYNLPQNLST